ncbi:MAG: imidazole glycerol phosphate synthase subunit HisF [Candidatus Peregrinibacteria bacterium]
MNKDIVRNSNSLAIRIIPCLDIANGRVVKGMSFTNLRDSGDPVELAKRYCEEGADELVFLDITATNENRRTVIDLASRVANAVNIPFTIGGGIRSVEDAKALLAAGADKVAINSAAVRNPQLLKEIAQAIGSANTICAIDGKRQSLCHSERRRTATKRRAQTWTVLVRGGRDDTGIDVVEWSRQVVELGAGELLVTSFDNDGQGQGFDTELLAAIKANVSVPVIASGGARSLQTFVDAVKIGKADAVLAATVFHFGKLTIKEVKTALSQSSFPIRP